MASSSFSPFYLVLSATTPVVNHLVIIYFYVVPLSTSCAEESEIKSREMWIVGLDSRCSTSRARPLLRPLTMYMPSDDLAKFRFWLALAMVTIVKIKQADFITL